MHPLAKLFIVLGLIGIAFFAGKYWGDQESKQIKQEVESVMPGASQMLFSGNSNWDPLNVIAGMAIMIVIVAVLGSIFDYGYSKVQQIQLPSFNLNSLRNRLRR